MADTTVTDSYITTIELAEAYFSGDPRATAFLALDSGMAWYLQRATKVIDALSLRGKKYERDGTQALQFPREYREGYDMDELTGVAEVPQNVLDACCEEALAIYLSIASTDRSERQALQADGVKSFSLGGGYSETFGPSETDKHYGLKSSEAYTLIARHVARSFPIT